MKVCLVHEEYPEETNFGGIATYQKSLAEEYVKLGHEVVVICRGMNKSYNYIENGVNVIRIYIETTDSQLNDYIAYRKEVARQLKILQKKHKIDIIETPDWGAETVFFEAERKIPLVVRLHTPLKIWLKFNKNDFGVITDTMLMWEEKMLKTADLITCCSNALKKIIIEEFGISSDNILVTPNPANIVNFFKDESINKEDSLLYVGSLEERKGVCVLAQALNVVFNQYPNLKIKFIGKDTTRNSRNDSTKQVIYDLVEKKYAKNIEFLGQIPNQDINKYLNLSRVAIFPSLFDNFPYAVLEAMATGVQIVGSRNSGMYEMLDDPSSIYCTGDYNDLAVKIIDKYELSKTEKYNQNNIDRVHNLYSPSNVCNNMLTIYKSVIEKHSLIKELEFVLRCYLPGVNIKYFNRELGGVANKVFKVVSSNGTYIIKKYIYNYDFQLSAHLYDAYEKDNINVIKPLNLKPIEHNNFLYNIFEYKEKDQILPNLDLYYLNRIICCERKTNEESKLLIKVSKYFQYLNRHINSIKMPTEEVQYVINKFNKLKDNDILHERYLNHGDLSLSNILVSNGKKYIIDFDETTVTTPLYDFAVIVIKVFTKNDVINISKFIKLREMVKKHFNQYTDQDFVQIVQFYLCKILLEKFYLHQIGKIDLYSNKQKTDNYLRYLNILKYIEKI